MANQRAQLLQTQAVQAILAALGATTVYGDSNQSPDRGRGVILAASSEVQSEIWSETYWYEPQPDADAKRYRYRVVATVHVERHELTSR